MSGIQAPWIGGQEDYKVEVVDHCDCCGEEICVGQDYYDINGTALCMRCIDKHLKTAESKYD